MSTKYIRKVLFIFVLLITSTILTVHAQAPDDPSTDDPAVPVDGGISLLLGAGAVLGGRKVMSGSPKKRA